MSTAVVSTSAAPGRPFLFDAESEAEVCPRNDSKKPSTGQQGSIGFQSTIKNQQSAIPFVTLASRLELRPLPEMVSSGISALDALTGGLPRGCLTEICGPASSGRTSVMLAALAAATRRGEYCAVIDASDALDPHSLLTTGIDLDRLLWVRCNKNSPRRHGDTEKAKDKRIGKGTASAVPYSFTTDPALAAEVGGFHLQKSFFNQREIDRTSKDYSCEDSRNRKQSEHRIEQVLRATDLLLESGGFGLIILDLADVPNEAARRIPLATWFRFRRAVEHKPTILLAIEQQPISGSCSSLLLQLKVLSSQFSVLSSATGDLRPSHAHLFTELEVHAELIRSRLDRKPARSIAFETKTAWAG